jgi:LemA protein
VVRSFPSNLTAMLFSFKEKPQFTVDNEKEISKAPAVDFREPKPAAGSPGSPPSEYTVPATK